MLILQVKAATEGTFYKQQKMLLVLCERHSLVLLKGLLFKDDFDKESVIKQIVICNGYKVVVDSILNKSL